MRRLAILAALLVAGCNLVLTEAPVFPDGAGGPRLHLKSGQYVMRDQDCAAFDTTQPRAQWPSCASLLTVQDDTILGEDRGAGEAATPFALIDGAPPILQAHLNTSDMHGFVYAGAELTARDAEGQVTSLRYWAVQCGPPASDENVRAGHYGTASPGPGLTMQGDDCSASDAAAVRAAATATRQRTSDFTSLEWLRSAPAR